MKADCPKCGSDTFVSATQDEIHYCLCENCGHQWSQVNDEVNQ